jgi:two-component system response regulator CpxR
MVGSGAKPSRMDATVHIMNSILIIDDDVKLCVMLREYLARHEIELTVRHNGEAGLKAAYAGQYDLMLLDVMLPDLGGFEVLKRLRVYSELSVLLLTARGQPADRIRGLQLGADDYLPKPFDPEELVARIRAVLRRSAPRSSIPPAKNAANRLSLGRLTIDLAARTVRYGNSRLDLTDIELSLLEIFMQSPEVVLTREEIVIRIFERPYHPLNRNLDMHVCRLRRKLRSATLLGNPIKTIRSSGYLFSTADI